jgi:hypothetical protein
VLGQLSLTQRRAQSHRGKHGFAGSNKRPFTLQRLLTVVRFVVRMRMGARTWAENERLRQRLADRVDEMEREDRIKQKRDQWRSRAKASLLVEAADARRRS